MQEKSDEKFENGPVTPHAAVVTTEGEAAADEDKREKRDTSEEENPATLNKDSPKHDQPSSQETPPQVQPKILSNPVKSGSTSR